MEYDTEENQAIQLQIDDIYQTISLVVDYKENKEKEDDDGQTHT